MKFGGIPTGEAAARETIPVIDVRPLYPRSVALIVSGHAPLRAKLPAGERLTRAELVAMGHGGCTKTAARARCRALWSERARRLLRDSPRR